MKILALIIAGLLGTSVAFADGMGPLVKACEAQAFADRPPVEEWDLKRDVVMWDREPFFLPDGRLLIVALANHKSLNRKPQLEQFGNLRDVNTIYWFFEAGRINDSGELEIYDAQKDLGYLDLNPERGQSAWTPAVRVVDAIGPNEFKIEMMVPRVDFREGTKQVFYRAILDASLSLESLTPADPVLRSRLKNEPVHEMYEPDVRHGHFPELNRDGKWVGSDFYFAVRVRQDGQLRSAIGLSKSGIDNLQTPLIPEGAGIDPLKYDEFEVPSPVFYEGELYAMTSATREVDGKVDMYIIGYKRDTAGKWSPIHGETEVISGPNEYYAAKFVPIPGRPGYFVTTAFRTEEGNINVKPTEVGISYFDSAGNFIFAFD